MASINTRIQTGLTAGTGSITTSTSSTTVTGTGTTFTTQVAVGQALLNSGSVVIGVVASIQSNTSLTLHANSAVVVTLGSYSIRSVGTTVKNSPLSSVEIDNNFITLNDSKVEKAEAVVANTPGLVVRRDAAGGFLSGSIGITGTLSVSTDATISGNGTITGDLALNGGDLTTTASTFNLLNATATTVNAFGAATTINIGAVNGTSTTTIQSATLTASNANTLVKSLGVGVAASGTSGEIRAVGNISSNYSDERLKENIEIIPDALAKVMSLRGVTFNANSVAAGFGYTTTERQVGVIAQDVKAVLPEVIRRAPCDIMMINGEEVSLSGQDYMTVQYEKIVPLLIEAIKTLNKELEEIKKTKGVE